MAPEATTTRPDALPLRAQELAQLLPDSLAPPIERLAKRVARSPLALLWGTVPLERLTGPVDGDGTLARVLVAGRSPAIQGLLRDLFAESPQREALGRCPLFRLPRLFRDGSSACHLLVARVPSGAGAWLFRDGVLRLPELVGAAIDVPPPGARWPRTRSARSNLRTIRAHGLRWTLSRDPADFTRFYDDLYLPYLRMRFGAAAAVRPRAEPARRFGRGALMWIWQGETLVAGVLVEVEGDTLTCELLGAVPSEKAARAAGALAATTLFPVEHAIELGLKRVSLGGNQPFLADPVLQSKRYSGAVLTWRARTDHDLVLSWPWWHPAVRALLAKRAPIHRVDRRFIGLAVATDEERAQLSRLAVPGLAGLALIGGEPQAESQTSDGLPVVRLTPASARELAHALAEALRPVHLAPSRRLINKP